MDQVANIVNFVKSHWVEIGVIAFALHTSLKAIADITETKKDDAFVEKFGAFIGYFFGKRPK